MHTMIKTDYLVIGSGIAGLTCAHLLSEFGNVLVITKGELKSANTYSAQGGIAAVIEKEDSFESHLNDTIKAGAGHNKESAVKYLVEHAPKAIRFLESIGVKFEKTPVLEACHSRPRVWRTSDFTGRDILNQLIKTVQKNKKISIKEYIDAVEIIESDDGCHGVFAREGDETELKPIFAKQTILATGGFGQLFGRTTNTLGSGGDGLALAINAGLELEDIEFVQFHPTALDLEDKGKYFLLSEVLRGFGARIVDQDGKQFIQQFDPRGELAPRDLVSRAVFFELMNGPVYLDMRHLDEKVIKKTFPNIYKQAKEYGFDIVNDKVPITPVAHYACGGIPVDLKGATKMPGLFAVGEVACTGVHGANRLASNSLLEAVVFSISIADSIERSVEIDKDRDPEIKDIKPPEVVIEDIAQVKAYSSRIGKIMWKRAGIIRTKEGLEQAKKQIVEIPARDYRIQHRQLVCYKILEACLNRPHSLGAHYISDELA
ncbi:L-aspartate oxidase [Candidatus Peregrinibacteria bacterium]|nr:L-aspartate oxidase [Candidatus Peregrinibacteria bacterium]